MQEVNIGIIGTSGVGKTTTSDAIKQICPNVVEVLHLDDYRFPNSKIAEMGLSPSDPRVIDYKTFLAHFRALRLGNSVVHYREYSFVVHDMVPAEKILHPRPTLVCEGWVLFYYKHIRNLFGVKILLDLDNEERVRRVLAKEYIRIYSKKIKKIQEGLTKRQVKYVTHVVDSRENPENVARNIIRLLRIDEARDDLS